MKSDLEVLKKRGFITSVEAEIFFSYSKEELFELLSDKQAFKRTATLYVLKNIIDINKFDEIILKMLISEKALYTKLEICNILSTGNEMTIKKMIPYVGKIGKNQHHDIAKKVSMKKSYPLPRDIIARTMAKMNPRYFESILENLNCGDDLVVAEIIDAVGWQVFYHQELAIEKYYQVIINLLSRYQNNQFMLWRLIICLSSFNQAEDLLRKWKSDNLIMNQEIQRSIDLIVKRKNL